MPKKTDWTDLALLTYHQRDYTAVMGDRHYGATEPLEPLAVPVRDPRPVAGPRRGRGPLLEVRRTADRGLPS